MKNKETKVFLFLILAPLILGAKTITTRNSGNHLTKETEKSVISEINPDSMDIYGDLKFICPGDAWEIAECQIIFKDTVAEIYVQGLREQPLRKEYFLITLNKPVTDRLKLLLYSIYSDGNTALKDGIPNERSVIGSNRSDLSINLILNGKIVNEFFHVWDIHYSYQSLVSSTNTLEPFKSSFYKMMELIYDILFQIDKEIYHGRRHKKATDWIENEFNYNYYTQGYRIVTDKTMRLRSLANVIMAIYRMACAKCSN